MGLMKKLTSAIVASSLVFSLVGSAFAAYTPAAGETAGARMQKLGILTGTPSGDLALNAEITRAELVTVIVRAFGQEENAKLLKGSTVFPDIANHWASGNIAMAAALVEKAGGDAIGMPDGKFNPDGKLTPAQAVAFLMKFLGVKRDATKAWPQDYLTAAVNAGIITAEDSAVIAPMLTQNATRGLVFYMFDRAFATYPIETGKTFYTKFVDTTLPTLTVAKLDATTVDNKVTITGTAKDNVAYGLQVFVGANKATLNADGTFSYTYDLPELKDYNVTVTAQDAAGNKATAPVMVTRTTGTAATVEAKLSAELLKAGTTADLMVTVKDKSGNVIKDAAYDVAVAGDIGTYADGKFTAAAKPATGSLTITSGTATTKLDVAVVAGDLAKIAVTPATTNVAVGTPVQFMAKGLDAAGNELAGNLNVTWSKTGGVIDAQGNFVGTASGMYTVTATANGVSGTATVTVFGQAVALKLAAIPDLVANATATQTVTASVVDASGNVVTGFNGTINFGVSNPTLAKLDSTTVTATNGVATVTLSSLTKLASSQNFAVSASASGLTGATATVKAAAQVLTSISATAGTSTLGADGVSNTNITFKELDQAGVELGTYTAVDLSLTNGNTSLVSLAANTISGMAAATTVNVRSIGAAEGTATITAAVTTSGKTGISVGSVTISTTQVGVPAAIVVSDVAAAKVDATGIAVDTDKDQSIKVKVVDAKGNQVTNPTLNGYVTITISETATAAATTAVSMNPTGGVATFKYRDTKAETVTYTVAASYDADGAGAILPANLESKTVTGTFNPGPVKALTLTGTPKPGTNLLLSADGMATGTLTAKLTDSRSNPVGEGSFTVTFQKTVDNNATADWTDLKTTAVTSAGVASVTITAAKIEQTDTYRASVVLADGSTIYSAPILVDTKIMGVATKSMFSSTVGANDLGAFAAGTSKDVKVSVQDQLNNVVTTDNGRAVTLKAFKTSDDTEIGSFTATTVSGTATLPVTLTYAGSVYFKATVDGATAPTNAVGAVAPAAASKIVLSADVTTLAADNLSSALVTVKLKDQYDNTATAAAATDITLKVDAGTFGAFGNAGATSVIVHTVAGVGTTQTLVDGSGASVAGADLKSTTAPGVVTLTATAPTGSTLTAGTMQITTIYGGFSASQYSISAVSDTTVGDQMEVDVYVQDSQGNRITNYAGTVNVTVNGSATVDAASKAAPKGKAVFYVSDTKAETVTFTVTANGGIASKTTTGNFLAAAATQLGITGQSNTAVKADGSTVVTYTVAAQDGTAQHNTVTTANGTVKVEITDGADYATVLTPTISITGGIGTFQVQAKYRESAKTITVKVTTTDMFQTNGTTPLTQATNSAVQIDGVAPAVVGTPTTDGTAHTVTVVFNKSMLEADVENTSNWTLTAAGAAPAVISGIVYTDATKTAVITLDKAWTANDTLKLNDSAVHDANSFFVVPTVTVTLP